MLLSDLLNIYTTHFLDIEVSVFEKLENYNIIFVNISTGQNRKALTPKSPF